MLLVSFPAPPFDENTFLLACRQTGQAVAIDPGEGTRALIDRVRSERLNVSAILLTHAHIDHISGIRDLRAALGTLPIHLHPADQFLYDAVVEQGRMFGLRVEPQPAPDQDLSARQEIEVGRLRLRVHETPGHSPGGVVFEVTDQLGQTHLIAGDTLFAGSIGRTDLPGGHYATLIRSIRTVLFKFEDDVPVYPGHYGSTTIGKERRTNPFLQGG
jgi:glyoxylase-like metal-dependent hydrolase (beta-lactamase superfamily II)